MLCVDPARGATPPPSSAASANTESASAARFTPPRTFVQVKGDLWRAGNGNWWSLIYVTPDGILLVDPINPDFAAWIKAELERRFPDKAVRYIVYSGNISPGENHLCHHRVRRYARQHHRSQ